MSLRDTIYNDMTHCLKSKQHVAVNALRFLLSEIANREIELHKQEQGLDDAEVVKIVSREVKRRRESAALYRKLDRVAEALLEEKELKALEKYVPEKVSGGGDTGIKTESKAKKKQHSHSV